MNHKMQTPDTLLNAEIKALLILLLLKSGTPSSDIQTALRLANGHGDDSDRDDRSRTPVQASSRPMPLRQCIRNDYLPPLKGYAA